MNYSKEITCTWKDRRVAKRSRQRIIEILDTDIGHILSKEYVKYTNLCQKIFPTIRAQILRILLIKVDSFFRNVLQKIRVTSPSAIHTIYQCLPNCWVVRTIQFHRQFFLKHLQLCQSRKNVLSQHPSVHTSIYVLPVTACYLIVSEPRVQSLQSS